MAAIEGICYLENMGIAMNMLMDHGGPPRRQRDTY